MAGALITLAGVVLMVIGAGIMLVECLVFIFGVFTLLITISDRRADH